MTVALLAKWGDQPPGTLYNSDAATEAAMITAKVATATLTGAVVWMPPGSSPGGVSLSPGQIAAIAYANSTPRKPTAAMELFECARWSSGGGTQNYTWAHVHSAWGDFNAVQILFANQSGSTTTVEDCIVAASANATDRLVPTGAWSAQTGAFTVPAGANGLPGLFLTPKIAVRSIPRNDGGRYPLLYSRMFFQTGNTTYNYSGPQASLSAANWSTRSEGHFILSSSQAGNSVATPGSFVSGGSNDPPFMIPLGYVFSYDYPMISIAGIGDSIMAGDFDTFYYSAPFGFKATARLNSAGKRVSWCNQGVSGQTVANFVIRGKTFIDTCAPSIIIIPSYSTNSVTTAQSDWDVQWQLIMDLAAYQVSKGGQVLILSPYVNNGFSSTTDGFRQVIRSRVLNCGYPYADIEAETSTGAFPARWKTGLNFDNTHPNDAGHEAIAPVVQAALLAYGMVG